MSKLTHGRKQVSGVGVKERKEKKMQNNVCHARSNPVKLAFLRSSGSPGNVVKMPCIHDGTRINSRVFGSQQQALNDDTIGHRDGSKQQGRRAAGEGVEGKAAECTAVTVILHNNGD